MLLWYMNGSCANWPLATMLTWQWQQHPTSFRLHSLAKMEPSIRALNISIRIISKLAAPISISTIGTFSCRRYFWQKLNYHPVQDTSSYDFTDVCMSGCVYFVWIQQKWKWPVRYVYTARAEYILSFLNTLFVASVEDCRAGRPARPPDRRGTVISSLWIYKITLDVRFTKSRLYWAGDNAAKLLWYLSNTKVIINK